MFFLRKAMSITTERLIDGVNYMAKHPSPISPSRIHPFITMRPTLIIATDVQHSVVQTCVYDVFSSFFFSTTCFFFCFLVKKT